MASSDDKFPAFNLRSLQGWTYNGYKLNPSWDVKKMPLLVNQHKQFYIIDAASENYLKGLRAQLDSELDEFWLECLLHAAYSRFDEPIVLQSILQLGADPDVLDASILSPCFRASTCCASRASMNVSLGSAEALSKCRPNLTRNGRTLAETSVVGLQDFWTKVTEDGFPSFAQLAHDQQWFAVQNLSRRNAVARQEAVHGIYQGKSAIEWVRHYQHEALEKELMFLFKIESAEVLDVGQVAGESRKNTLEIAGSPTVDNASELEKKVTILEAENCALTEEVGQLGEALKAQGARLTFIQEEMEKLKVEREAEMEKLQAEIKALPGQLSGMLPSLIESTVAAAFGAARISHDH